MGEPSIVDTWERLVRFHRTATDRMDAHLREEFGRSLDDYDVLHQIHVNRDPIRMGDLAERLLVANSSCNRIVGRLDAAGLVSRSHDDRDRRAVLVQLTTEGRSLRRRMATVHTRDIHRILGSLLDRDDRADLDRVLQRLLAGRETDRQ